MRAEVGTGGAATAASRTGMVGARGFEPPTSSSRTMRATKLRHAPTEVLVEQSPGIVARPDPDRCGRSPRWGLGSIPADGERSAAMAIGAGPHRSGESRSPEVLLGDGDPVPTAHSPPREGRRRFRSRAVIGDPRVAREGRHPSARTHLASSHLLETSHEARPQGPFARLRRDVRGVRRLRHAALGQDLVAGNTVRGGPSATA